MDCNDSDYVVNTSPVADEQPQPDPVMPEAAAQGSPSTEPSSTLNDDAMLEYYHALRHLHFHRFSAPMHISAVRHYNAFSHVMEEIVLDDIPTMLFVGGVLVADSGGYANGGFGAIPASGDAMADLPKTTVGEGEIKGEKTECAVCLEAYQVGDTVRTMPCSHDFHESCIFEWLRVSRLCPLCRFALPAAAETESFMGEEDASDAESNLSSYYAI